MPNQYTIGEIDHGESEPDVLCLMSSFLFLIAVDDVMNKVESGYKGYRDTR